MTLKHLFPSSNVNAVSDSSDRVHVCHTIESLTQLLVVVFNAILCVFFWKNKKASTEK